MMATIVVVGVLFLLALNGNVFGNVLGEDGTVAGHLLSEVPDTCNKDETVTNQCDMPNVNIHVAPVISVSIDPNYGPKESTKAEAKQPLDCSDLKSLDFNRSRHYIIYPYSTGDTEVKVWCDMTTEGGGWTVIQRREDGSVDFKRTWNDYKRGFGYIGGEFWIGNDNLHHITHQKSYELRVEVEFWNELVIVTNVNHIRVANEQSKYELHVGSSASEGICDNTSTLGMEDERIQGHQITVSTTPPSCSHKCNGNNGRLNLTPNTTHVGAWVASILNQHQWIQVYVGGWRLVAGVVTQGRYDTDEWITKYMVWTSVEGTSWANVTNTLKSQIVFRGNSDRNTPVTNMFDSPVKAKFVRIVPLEWHRHISLRFELLGCNAYAWTHLNFQPFSTYDVDNDDNNHSNCAAHGGAWWYDDACALTGLNGENLDGIISENKGIKWEHEGIINYVRRTEMKIRPRI